LIGLPHVSASHISSPDISRPYFSLLLFGPLCVVPPRLTPQRFYTGRRDEGEPSQDSWHVSVPAKRSQTVFGALRENRRRIATAVELHLQIALPDENLLLLCDSGRTMGRIRSNQ
jgi:hypothetical protein